MAGSSDTPDFGPTPEEVAWLGGAHVHVLGGGGSTEHAVSMKSLDALEAACERLREGGVLGKVTRHELDSLGAALEALRPPEAQAAGPSGPWRPLCLLALHGGGGEDGTLQGALASLGLAHTGSGVLGSALGMDKERSRWVAAAAGISVAPGHVLDSPDLPPDLDRGPWFVKPVRGGSSVATGCARTTEELQELLADVHAVGDRALVESAIAGVEVTVPILEDAGRVPHPLPLVEIRPSDGAFFDFEQKYSEQGAREFCPPVSLSPARQAEVQALGLRAFLALGFAGYGRMDFIVPEEGPPVFLEGNSLPGFTARSLMPLSAAQAGLSFDDLVSCILARAVPR